MVFELTLIPCIGSSVLRDMHRQTKRFEAPSLTEAQGMVRCAFPNGVDESGEWFIENLTPAWTMDRNRTPTTQ